MNDHFDREHLKPLKTAEGCGLAEIPTSLVGLDATSLLRFKHQPGRKDGAGKRKTSHTRSWGPTVPPRNPALSRREIAREAGNLLISSAPALSSPLE